MRLTLLTDPCEHGQCPALYATDRGTVVVQGGRVAHGDVPGGVPGHEEVVEIPADLLRQAVARLD